MERLSPPVRQPWRPPRPSPKPRRNASRRLPPPNRVTLTLAPDRTTSNTGRGNAIRLVRVLSSRARLPSESVRILLAAVLAAALAAPASASAATLTARLDRASVRYGQAHRVTGTLLEGGQPLVGQDVVLEGRRYPFEGSYRVIERSKTDAKGAFSFSV